MDMYLFLKKIAEKIRLRIEKRRVRHLLKRELNWLPKYDELGFRFFIKTFFYVLITLVVFHLLFGAMTHWVGHVIFGADFRQLRYFSRGVFTLFLFTFLMSVVIYRLAKPILLMLNGIQELEKGNLEFRFQIPGRSKLGLIAKKFNTMASEIQNLLALKEQLLRDVSHELRSPLGRIKISLELMAPQNPILARSAQEDLKLMEDLIRILLERARIDQISSKDYVPVDLNEMARHCVGVMPKNLVDWEESTEEMICMGSPHHLKLALQNVLQNALAYGEPQGKPIVVRIGQNADFIWISVQDFGKGMSPSFLQKIGEPFQREDESRAHQTPGFGLGMHITKRILDKHKGILNVHSVLGAGTTVTLTFRAKL